ncbi:hypothetical protein L211DRAFT_835934, partial [Terfezia boudieri ATCC MYA-4762]
MEYNINQRIGIHSYILCSPSITREKSGWSGICFAVWWLFGMAVYGGSLGDDDRIDFL